MKFYLVGSRFFGTHRDDSDWDYLGADTLENRLYCESLGLKQIPSIVPGAVRYFGNGVDICLVDNLEARLKARDEVARIPGVELLSKSERHQKLKEITDAL